jgi:hypothetical protein
MERFYVVVGVLVGIAVLQVLQFLVIIDMRISCRGSDTGVKKSRIYPIRNKNPALNEETPTSSSTGGRREPETGIAWE